MQVAHTPSSPNKLANLIMLSVVAGIVVGYACNRFAGLSCWH